MSRSTVSVDPSENKARRDAGRWIEVMKHALTLNASFFDTHRRVDRHVLHTHA